MFDITSQFEQDIAKLNKVDKKLGSKVWELVIECLNNRATPLAGLGKPEPLKHNLKGHYSRRITDEHRLVYRYEGDTLFLVSCYGHYI